MNITTRFNLDQSAFFARVKLEAVMIPCPRCQGQGGLTVREDSGEEHRVTCPNSGKPWDSGMRCHYGQVKAGVRYHTDIQEMTVGQVRVEVGGITGHSNMGEPHQQTREQVETVMCYETGIGSGSVYHTEPRVGVEGASACFVTREEALWWGTAMERMFNSKLKMDLIHEAALIEDDEREAR